MNAAGADDVSSDGVKSVSNYIGLTAALDSQTVLQVVSPKLFDHFTLWDLMLAKAKLHIDDGSLGTIVNDTALVLCELKILIENCLKPILVGKLAVKKKSDECIEFDDMLTTAMGLDTNLWLKRGLSDINYTHALLEVENLFPPKKSAAEGGGRASKVKVEVIEEEEEEAQDDDHIEDGSDNEGGREDDDDPEFKPNDSEDSPKKKGRMAKKKVVLKGKKKGGKKVSTKPPKPQKRWMLTADSGGDDEKTPDGKKGEFTCGKCGKNYLNYTAWYKHMEKSCAARSTVRVSIRTVGDRFFCAYKHCHEPRRPFATKDDVHDHWSLHHVDEDLKFVPCFVCEMKFATLGAKRIHMGEVHLKKEGGMGNFSGSVQVKERKRKSQLIQGEGDQEDQYLCLKCGQAVSKEQGKKHEENCNGTSGQAKKAKRHTQSDGGEGGESSKERYLCLKCGQSMNKEYGQKHETKCNGMYVRKPEYRKVDQEYFCTVAGCNLGYGFNSMYGLQKHFHGQHTREEEKFFKCDYCDEKFSFQTTRNKHVKAIHLKSYVCDICGKGFGSKDKMTHHRFTHTGEKPYACEKCDYRAAKRFNLEAHMESKHGVFQQKDFVCAVCNKQFVTMGRVRRHMNEIHADGMEDDGGAEGGSGAPTRKRKRQRGAPPPPVVAQMQLQQQQQLMQEQQQGGVVVATAAAGRRIKRVVMPQQHQQHHAEQHRVEQDEAVQYLETELGQHRNDGGPVITIRPLYQ